MPNQNKKESHLDKVKPLLASSLEEKFLESSYPGRPDLKPTPPSKSSSWEEKLKSYMVDLIDEYFPKDNQDNPELPSTTHRSEAMASHALFLIKFKEVLASQRADERERVLKEVLEKLPKEEELEWRSECCIAEVEQKETALICKKCNEFCEANRRVLSLSEVKEVVRDLLNNKE